MLTSEELGKSVELLQSCMESALSESDGTTEDSWMPTLADEETVHRHLGRTLSDDEWIDVILSFAFCATKKT